MTKRHEMNISTLTVACPECGEPATLIRIEYPGEDGEALRHELEFECHNGHALPEDGLPDPWAGQDVDSPG